MLTIPTALWPDLLSRGFRPVEVYEIEAFAGRAALYFAPFDLTWDGNDYVGLAVSRTPIKEVKDTVVSETEVTFTNVANPLRAHVSPVDTLTGARLTVRHLQRDSSNAFRSDSLIRFVGTIEPPSRITETVFAMRVVGLIDGAGKELPAQRLAIPCPWQYANSGAFDGGGECPYEHSTLANGGGTATATLHLDSPSTFANGDFIFVGSNPEVYIVSGAGTTTLTLSLPLTWANHAPVSYSRCDRARASCAKHEVLFAYGGFPAAGVIARAANPAIPRSDRGQALSLRLAASDYADPTLPVPVLLGRRRVRPRIIEAAVIPGDSGAGAVRNMFLAFSAGPIDDNNGALRYYVDNVLGVDSYQNGEKGFGIYYRLGNAGVDDIETAAEYMSDPVTQTRDQNVDYRSLSAVAYSLLAYVIFRQGILRSTVTTTLPTVEIDGKGIVVIAYDADGTPGSPAWSRSPIWHSVLLALSPRVGLGLRSGDIDYAVAKESADYAVPLIESTEANTTVKQAQGSASTKCKVVSAEGFVPGRRVDVNGVANTVDLVVSDDELKLVDAVTQSIGHTVVSRPQRFETHLYMTRSDKAINWFKKLMLACRGYITSDAGKLQFRIERDHVKERLVDGGMEVWSSSTNLTNWTENLGSGEATIHQDSALAGSTGAYSVRIDRTGGTQFAGVIATRTGLEPGRWYRIVFKHKQDALGIGAACRLRIRNTTQNLGCESDGFTWATAPVADPISKEGTTAASDYEFTFKVREDFPTTDTIEFALAPYFSAGHSVWYDDASLRGPYAGDFREFVTNLNMGWADGTFVWSLDRKDREINRVALQFINESANFGNDEVAADDFIHQQTHPIKTLNLTCDAIADRDQARRIVNVELAKRRELGPGCEFVGTPAALALQPGDVILVTATVPGWVCKEQRVIETEVIGLGDNDEHFVTVRTEDYLESIYSDVGQPQNNTPEQEGAAITVTVTRNTGGVLELLITGHVRHSVTTYRIHMSADAGFTPDATNMIGETASEVFTYQVPVQDLDVNRYLIVVAVSAFGAFVSDEIATTIFLAENPTTGGGYTNDFQFPTAVATPSGFTAFSPATVGNVNDASDSTYNEGEASLLDGVADLARAGIRYHSFGAGTGKTGRPYVRGYYSQAGQYIKHRLYYTLDRTAGSPTWVLWQEVTGATPTDYFGPELTGVDYSKFAIEGRVEVVGTPVQEITIARQGRHYAVAFDEKS